MEKSLEVSTIIQDTWLNETQFLDRQDWHEVLITIIVRHQLYAHESKKKQKKTLR